MKFSSVKRIMVLLGAFLLSGCSGVQSTLNPQSPEAQKVTNLSWLMFAIAIVVVVVVTVLLLLTVRRSRTVEGDAVQTAYDDRRTVSLVLIGGALIPAIVLIGVMSLSIVIDKADAAQSANALTVYILGHQWWWEVRYPDSGVVTANEIHVPAGQTVTFKVSTADVIHSFWVPELHGKIDLIPGQTNTISIKVNHPGEYRGQCAEFCGLQHAHMAFLVIADEPQAFQQWLNNQIQPAPDPPAGSVEKEGQQAFLGSSCVYCHTIRGTNASGLLGPDLTHLADRRMIGAGMLLNNKGNLAGWIVNSQAIKPGNKMPPMDLNSDQIQSILAYLATLK